MDTSNALLKIIKQFLQNYNKLPSLLSEYWVGGMYNSCDMDMTRYGFNSGNWDKLIKLQS